MTWTERLDRLLDTTRMDDEDEIRRAIDGAMKERRNAALEEAAEKAGAHDCNNENCGHLSCGALRRAQYEIRAMKETAT